MTKTEANKAIKNVSDKVSAAQTAYNVAYHAHFVPGNRYDTPGPTLDAMTAARKELDAAIEEARSLARDVWKYGTLEVTRDAHCSSVSFRSNAHDAKNDRMRSFFGR